MKSILTLIFKIPKKFIVKDKETFCLKSQRCLTNGRLLKVNKQTKLVIALLIGIGIGIMFDQF